MTSIADPRNPAIPEKTSDDSEARFRAFVTASSDVVYRMNPDWTQMRQLVGQTFLVDTHAPSKLWLDRYIHPDDQPMVRAAIDQAIASRSMFELEHRVIRADGSLGWTFSRAVPILSATGEIEEWLGTAKDVGARKRAEAALRLSEARLAADLAGMQRLHALHARLAGEMDLRVALETIVRTACELLDTDRGCVQLVSDDGERLEMFAFHGYGSDSPFIAHFLHEGSKPACDAARRDRTRLIIEDVATFPPLAGTADRAVALADGICAIQSTPMISRDGELRGVLSNQFPAPHRPTEEQLWLIDLLVWTAADFVARHKSERTLRESEERHAFLLHLTDVLRPLTEPGEIERQATRLLGKHLEADRCFLSPVYEDGYGMGVREEYLRAGASSVLGDYTFAQFGDFVGPELHAGRILAVENVDALTGLDATERASYAATEIGAYLLVPLVRNERLAAFLTVNHRTPRPWSNADKAVARQTADRLWIARERARAEAATQESEALRRVALDSGRMGTWRWDLQNRSIWGDALFLELWGFPPSDSPHALSLFTDRMSSSGMAEMELMVTRAIEAGEEFDGQLEIVDGPTAGHWIRWRGRAHARAPSLLYGVTFDVTAQRKLDEKLREHDERQQVLVGELQHRTRNLMGVVRSMSDATLRTSTDLDDFEGKFRDRLAALARVQGLLSRLAETDRITFDELLRTELTAHGALGHEERRVTLKGPARVPLRSSTVQTLAMALHELATNAIKHGALGTARGRLAVEWRLEPAQGESGPMLHVDWRESGVPMPPPGLAQSCGSGQGRELIEKALPYQLKAKTTFVLGEDGLHCTISMPVPERVSLEVR